MAEFTRVGSTQLLQDLASRRLIGLMCSVIDADNCGWIVLTFSSTPGAFELENHEARSVLVIERGIALSFAAMLQVHAREASLLRDPVERCSHAAAEPGALDVGGGVRDAPLVLSWKESLAIGRRDVQDQVELRIPDIVAGQVATALIERLAQAQVAAHDELLGGPGAALRRS